VHAFAESSIGPIFFVLIGLVLIASVGLLLWRWNQLSGVGELHSLFSRESIFLFNNILFICLFLICLTGVLFPIISEVLTGQQVTVGAQWYKSTTGPLFALLLLLMGVVPLTVWGASTAKVLGKSLWKPAAVSLLIPVALIFLGVGSLGGIMAFWLAGLVVCVSIFDLLRTSSARSRALQEPFFVSLQRLIRGNHRRYGGYLVHIGVVLMAVGIVGIEFFQTQTQVTLNTTTPVTFGNFSLQFSDLASATASNGLQSTTAQLTVRQAGGATFTLTPRVDLYPTDQQAVTVPGEYSTLAGDLYVVLVDWQPLLTTGATFRIYYNPLIDWFWLGAIVLVLGGLFAFSPAKRTMKPMVVAA
jgi:cytochrome c-type biogenesis protein CcmF